MLLCVILDVVSVPDSALVRIEHNWVAPDPLKVSQSRYKKVVRLSLLEGGWNIPRHFYYKGKIQIQQTGKYFDR